MDKINRGKYYYGLAWTLCGLGVDFAWTLHGLLIKVHGHPWTFHRANIPFWTLYFDFIKSPWKSMENSQIPWSPWSPRGIGGGVLSTALR